MTLLEDIVQQRIAFLRKGYVAPNRLLVPRELRHQLFGEFVDAYRPLRLQTDSTAVMGMRVCIADTSRIEVALCL